MGRIHRSDFGSIGVIFPDSKAGEKAAGRNVVANGMGYVDPTHGAHTAMVKAA